jgi:hypothetical protein
MTSAAATQAGRTGHRSATPQPVRAGGGPAPRVPRRVSGPSRGAAGIPRVSRAQAGAATLPRPGGGLALPRPGVRMPRPALPRRRPRTAPAAPPLTRAATFLLTLPDRRWLDRLVRGRAWIPLFGVLLTGIVFMQVEVLKLGAGIGRSVSQATELQSKNQLLRASVARLSDDNRIERLAVHLGMTMPGPTERHFVSAGGRGILQRALSQITPPNSQTFLAGIQAENAAALATDPVAAAATSAGSSAAAAAINSPALGPASSVAAPGGAAATTGTGGASTTGAGGTSSGATSVAGTGTAAPATTPPATTAPATTAPATTASAANGGVALAGASGPGN